MTAPDYRLGAVKQDPAGLAAAVRTIAAAGSDHEWAVMTVDHGGHFCGYADVADWPDLTGRPRASHLCRADPPLLALMPPRVKRSVDQRHSPHG
jgi:hypothetical protein